MRKTIILILCVVALALFNDLSSASKLIPDEAIRLRVLANSNSKHDQEVKKKVSSELQSSMYSLLYSTNTINEARTVIKDNIDNFKKTVGNTLATADSGMTYSVDYGIHHFPEKMYKGVKYEEGNYESLLVKIGEGKGDNWWCVLFPPLCLLEAEETTSDVEYKFFVQELIDKFF